MLSTETDTIRVNVPVGLLLPEEQEVVLSVDRPESGPLSIKLRLIPADSGVVSVAAPRTAPALARRPAGDPYAEFDLGGSD